MTPRPIALLGPTASGKTRLALELAERLPVEIISLDSALVYRDMDIGTAKPSPVERAIAPHHLIDIILPPEAYSAAQFVTDCTRLCQQILARDRWPLIVGGTMMYYHALTHGLNQLPEADPAIRAALQAEKEAQGLAALYAKLQQYDPATAERLKPGDSQRIERALEVYLLTGKPLSAHFAEQQAPASALPDLTTIALIPEDRSLLHRHIAQRFETMLQQGFLEEVERLAADYPELTPDYPSIRCVGYRQAWEYRAGLYNYTEFVEKGIAATRQLAKRQLTWLRKLDDAHILNPHQQQGSLLDAAMRMIEQKPV